MALSHQETWRFVPVITAGIAALQILAGPTMRESPVWLTHKTDAAEIPQAEERNSFTADSDAGERCTLIFRNYRN